MFLALRTSGKVANSDLSLAADVLAPLATLTASVLCALGHQRSPRPSTILGLYLSASVLLSFPRTRTLWLLATGDGPLRLAAVMSVCLALSTVALVLESANSGVTPRNSPSRSHKAGSPEQYSSLWSRTSFAWLASTFWRGYRSVVSLEDLPPLDTRLRSEEMSRSLALGWGTCTLRRLAAF